MGSRRSARLVALAIVVGTAAALLPVAPSGSAGRQQLEVRWGARTVQPGTPITARGRTPRGQALVALQVRLPSGWRTFGQARSAPTGRFAVSGRLDWYGTHRIRLTTTGQHPFRRVTTARVLPTYLPRGDPADHAFTDADRGVRYSFDPCEPVRYAVNTDAVGADQLPLIRLGIDQVAAATGIEMRYVGVSHQVPFGTGTTRLPPGQDLLVAWATGAEVPGLLTPGALGLSGPVLLRGASDGRGRPVTEIREAAVVLDAEDYADTTTYSQSYLSTRPTWGEVILHELGHAFGLDHVQATDEIMYPDAGAGSYPDGTFRGQYDAGDLAGLATNGLGQGCFGPARHREAAAALAAPPPQP
jgi:hypothetical protein